MAEKRNTICGIRRAQEGLGDNDIKTTMILTHLFNRGGKGVTSPMDEL